MEATTNKTTLANLLYDYRLLVEGAEAAIERARELKRKASALASGHLHNAMYDAGCVVVSGDHVFTYDPDKNTISIGRLAWAYEIEVDAPEQDGD